MLSLRILIEFYLQTRTKMLLESNPAYLCSNILKKSTKIAGNFIPGPLVRHNSCKRFPRCCETLCKTVTTIKYVSHFICSLRLNFIFWGENHYLCGPITRVGFIRLHQENALIRKGTYYQDSPPQLSELQNRNQKPSNHAGGTKCPGLVNKNQNGGDHAGGTKCPRTANIPAWFQLDFWMVFDAFWTTLNLL